MAILENRDKGGTNEQPADKGPFSTPAITLPKGGGAIRGMGEKFAANPVTGTGSVTLPIATSPGRSGFGPQLALCYDSGTGNGPFGFGWSLSLPSITRKTDKGLPQYRDAEESDVFILSGAEDLVPVLVEVGGSWQRETLPPRTVDGVEYRIQRYRPRIEGLFGRIERWTNLADARDTFWRSISKDNVTTFYGKSAESRIADPTRIFSWLICQSYELILRCLEAARWVAPAKLPLRFSRQCLPMNRIKRAWRRERQGMNAAQTSGSCSTTSPHTN